LGQYRQRVEAIRRNPESPIHLLRAAMTTDVNGAEKDHDCCKFRFFADCQLQSKRQKKLSGNLFEDKSEVRKR
jgi:hypothetical protein